MVRLRLALGGYELVGVLFVSFISFLFANSIFIYSCFAYRKIRKVQIGACLESRLQDLTRVLVSAII